MGNKYIWLLGIIGVSLLLTGGIWFWTFFAGERNPKFQSVSVEPKEFRFVGGSLLVNAEVTDDVAVHQVLGTIMEGESEVSVVELTRSVEGERPVYSAEFTVPANIRNNGQPTDYTLQLLAVDNTGQKATKEVGIRVTAPDVPPAPPQLPPAD